MTSAGTLFIAPSPSPGDHLLTGVSVARECGMVSSSHRLVVAETTPTSYLTYRVLGEGRQQAESGDCHMTPLSLYHCDIVMLVDHVRRYTDHMTSSADEGTTPLISRCSRDLCPQFHLAVDGKSFADMREDHPTEYQRVGGPLSCDGHVMVM